MRGEWLTERPPAVSLTLSVSVRCDRHRLAAALAAAGIPCHVILDAAAGAVLGRADLVLVGAEGVVESGGIINQVPMPTHAYPVP
jgi:hypothetical protein